MNQMIRIKAKSRSFDARKIDLKRSSDRIIFAEIEQNLKRAVLGADHSEYTERMTDFMSEHTERMTDFMLKLLQRRGNEQLLAITIVDKSKVF
jgi:hypothetical protein